MILKVGSSPLVLRDLTFWYSNWKILAFNLNPPKSNESFLKVFFSQKLLKLCCAQVFLFCFITWNFCDCLFLITTLLFLKFCFLLNSYEKYQSALWDLERAAKLNCICCTNEHSLENNNVEFNKWYISFWVNRQKNFCFRNPTPIADPLLDHQIWPTVSRGDFSYFDINMNMTVVKGIPRAYKEWVPLIENYFQHPLATL